MTMKYTKEILEAAVKDSNSMAGVLRHLGVRPSGGMHSHLSRRIDYFGIDTGHFTGQGWSKGRKSRNRKSPEDVLVVLPEGSNRTKTNVLRRALKERGVTYECSSCKISDWMGEEIVLYVDHIDGNYLDNREENLRYLCPNCHSQTDTYCGKNISRRSPTGRRH